MVTELKRNHQQTASINGEKSKTSPLLVEAHQRNNTNCFHLFAFFLVCFGFCTLLMLYCFSCTDGEDSVYCKSFSAFFLHNLFFISTVKLCLVYCLSPNDLRQRRICCCCDNFLIFCAVMHCCSI